jgi:hypothetical protein
MRRESTSWAFLDWLLIGFVSFALGAIISQACHRVFGLSCFYLNSMTRTPLATTTFVLWVRMLPFVRIAVALGVVCFASAFLVSLTLQRKAGKSVYESLKIGIVIPTALTLSVPGLGCLVVLAMFMGEETSKINQWYWHIIFLYSYLATSIAALIFKKRGT